MERNGNGNGMERWVNRIALVTGASAGIGAAICKLLCENGMKVVGCARRVEKIEELQKNCHGLLFPYKCDLSNEEEINAMYKWIEENPKLGKIDVCIPNAGLSFNTTLLDGRE
jgi:NADP-dependent 3-hydroxy acid dehydrogenase YdfG